MMNIRRWIPGLVLTATLAAQVPMASLASNGFSDVLESNPNYTAIMDLKARGIIQGYPDGTFRADQPVNRVEALKIIELGSGVDWTELRALGNFKDINPAAWYMPYLHKAVELGIVSGYPDGTFQPTRTVNLVENLKILLLAKKINTFSVPMSGNPYADAYTTEWYAPYVQIAKDKNLITANWQNMIFPDQEMTRGKLAETMYRLIYIQEKGLASYSPATLIVAPTPATPPPSASQPFYPITSIQIQSSNTAFISATTDALHLLEKSQNFLTAKPYIGIIQEGDHSGMSAWLTPPTYSVNKTTWSAENLWYASTIAHDAYHSYLYHKYLEQHPGETSVPADVWTGKQAEIDCMTYQKKVLDEICTADRCTVFDNYLTELMKNPKYQLGSYEERNW